MKTIQEILIDTSPKNMEKIYKGFENGECLQYMDAVLEEIARPTAVDFNKMKCVVTDNYYVDYSSFTFSVKKIMRVAPLNKIAAIYRSNIAYWDNNQYDYNAFHVTLELKDGTKIPCNSMVRAVKGSYNAYDEIIAYVKNRIYGGEAQPCS